MMLSVNHEPWADLAVFEESNAAKVVEAFLTGEGVQARTYDDKLFRYFLFLRPPRVTFRVQVRQNDFYYADKFLANVAPAMLQRAVRCPFCSSLRVSYPQMTRKFFFPTVVLHLVIIFRILDHECYCDRCHFIWNLPPGRPEPAAKTAALFPLSPQSAKPANARR